MSERSATFDNARASQVRPDQAAAGYESPALCYVRMGKLLQEKSLSVVLKVMVCFKICVNRQSKVFSPVSSLINNYNK